MPAAERMAELGEVDLLVIGGGVNGAGVARDAAGRGLSVLLCERTISAREPARAPESWCTGGFATSNTTSSGWSARR